VQAAGGAKAVVSGPRLMGAWLMTTGAAVNKGSATGVENGVGRERVTPRPPRLMPAMVVRVVEGAILRVPVRNVTLVLRDKLEQSRKLSVQWREMAIPSYLSGLWRAP